MGTILIHKTDIDMSILEAFPSIEANILFQHRNYKKIAIVISKHALLFTILFNNNNSFIKNIIYSLSYISPILLLSIPKFIILYSLFFVPDLHLLFLSPYMLFFKVIFQDTFQINAKLFLLKSIIHDKLLNINT